LPLTFVNVAFQLTSQAQTPDLTSRPRDVELPEAGAAVPHPADDRRAVLFDPGRGAGQRTQQPRELNLPLAELEVEVVLAIPWLKA
jgi:hypothetical protein